ncbi:inosine-uridine preferring nucleoside hydrolase [Halarchaeum acidiphilum MH1-52-1]|uniref:Inosine-uridine preferring nucleoside hydrolase n=1 Tax=Halarchaeum acidiphilum MH1-52-1 TaxID=1261545 RepID=U3AD63_9EURY|nr:nucleoside hydrolase [Halarchaeum acidiphilum]GAD52718.1 inosine-uridine preferring nucleoside hydrolase [Halarchaeum acidiphilum MH1-52-1]
MARKVLFDTDPGCDDAVMLAAALGHNAIDVVGLTTVCGNSTVENTTRNARAILELGGYDVPVARGCARPLVDELATAEWVHGEGGIRGDMPYPSGDVGDEHAADVIVRQARKHGDDLTIAAVGPLPNLAFALAKEPDLPEIVDRIYVMGGAALSSGNVTPVAEANFHNDPAAASRVVQDAFPRMVGLDVTNDATIPFERIESYAERGGVFETIAEWARYPTDAVDVDETGPSIHDAAVLADIVDPDVLDFEEYYCEIDTTGGPSHGSVVCDQHGVYEEEPNAAVAVDIDVERYREIVDDGLSAYAAHAEDGE